MSEHENCRSKPTINNVIKERGLNLTKQEIEYLIIEGKINACRSSPKHAWRLSPDAVERLQVISKEKENLVEIYWTLSEEQKRGIMNQITKLVQQDDKHENKALTSQTTIETQLQNAQVRWELPAALFGLIFGLLSAAVQSAISILQEKSETYAILLIFAIFLSVGFLILWAAKLFGNDSRAGPGG